MNKERANEIMRELKENCARHDCCNCIFWSGTRRTSCKLILTNPMGYTISVLDEKEKEYLSNIVKPFRDKVKHIQKLQSSTDKREYIEIKIRHDSDINLPYFNENTMYKEMELGKEYTLEELGI